MAFQDGERRVLRVLPEISFQLTQHAATVFTSLLVLRGYLHHNHLSLPFVIPSIQFESSAIDLTVFIIGVAILFLCLLSLLSLFRIIVILGVERVVNFLLNIQLRVGWLVCALGLLLCSCIYSLWLFVFVRRKWSSSFAEPVQILHVIPTVVFLLHTVVKFLTLISADALADDHYNNNEREDIITHLRVVKLVTWAFIIYCVSIYIIASDDFNTTTFLLSLSELLFRLLFLVFAKNLENRILAQVNPPVPIEEPVQAIENLPIPIEEPVQAIENPPIPIEEPVQAIENLPIPIEEPVQAIENLPIPIEEPVQAIENPPIPIEEPVQAIENPPIPGENMNMLTTANSEGDQHIDSVIAFKNLSEYTEYELCGVRRDNTTRHSQLVLPTHSYELERDM